jgi:hypothetical protein
LAGYKDNGLLDDYTGDLDDIVINSGYSFSPANVTNEPADCTNISGVFTSMQSGGTRGVQTIMGMQADTQYKIWQRILTTTWGAWKLVVDGGAFPQRLDGYQDNGFTQYTPNIDLNDVIHNSRNWISTSTLNRPPFTSGFIICDTVPGDNADYVTQTAYGNTSEHIKTWQRQRVQSVWQDWVLIIDGPAAAGVKPVGALEFGYDPNGILPGTWTQWPEGTFIMNTIAGADAAGGSNDAVVVTHHHGIRLQSQESGWNTRTVGGNSVGATSNGISPDDVQDTGVAGTNLNKPLYKGVAVWERTA